MVNPHLSESGWKNIDSSTLLRSVQLRITDIYVYVIARAGVIFGIYISRVVGIERRLNRTRRSRVLFRRSTENEWNIFQNFTTARAISY